MNKERLTYLLDRYGKDMATAEEIQELQDLIGRDGDQDLFSDVVTDLMEKDRASATELTSFTHLADKVLQIDKVTAASPGLRVHLFRRWSWAAACLLLLFSGGAYLWLRQSDVQRPPTVYHHNDIVPGKNGAVLTLADGTQVVLDSVRNGIIATQNGAQVVVKKGQLVYDRVEGSSGEMTYNTMTIPKGRQFHMQLPDGTEVWLNSASSIRYPTAFVGQERKVEITGEAYFEVKKDKERPFRVAVNDQSEIEVLGTGFNVNAYKNEGSLNTTLLEGSVRVKTGSDAHDGSGSVVLGPGQQAQVVFVGMSSGRQDGAQRIRVIDNADIDKVMAWKNGLFDFNDATLESVMKQLERWYDIDVEYEKNIPVIRFFGKMTKNIALNDLLTILEKSKVHFRVEGRKLIVQP